MKRHSHVQGVYTKPHIPDVDFVKCSKNLWPALFEVLMLISICIIASTTKWHSYELCANILTALWDNLDADAHKRRSNVHK